MSYSVHHLDEFSAKYEPLHRLQFFAPSSLGAEPVMHLVFSGLVFPGPRLENPLGDDHDNLWVEFEINMMVGPYWQKVIQVVPHVSIGHFVNENSDEDDMQSWGIRNLTWDTVKEPGLPGTDERIRLRFLALLQGAASKISSFNYYVTASGIQTVQQVRQGAS